MGIQIAYDFGIPQIISARTNNGVTGGQIAYLVSGTASVVSSGLSSLAAIDILVDVPASGINFPAGIILQTAGSATSVGLMVRGVVIVTASTAVTAGDTIACINGASAVDVITSGTAAAQMDIKQRIGKTLTSAASGGYCLALIDVA